MTPSQIRAELLGEHFALRELIDEARARVAATSDPSASDRSAIDERLADSVEKIADHSQHEEAAARVILTAPEARAPGRDAVMDSEHVAEHLALVLALREAAATTDPVALRQAVKELLGTLEEHMAHEEAVLLADDLLLPDDVVISFKN